MSRNNGKGGYIWLLVQELEKIVDVIAHFTNAKSVGTLGATKLKLESALIKVLDMISV